MATTASIVPKESKSNLEPTANTIAFQNGLVYDYYAIKLGSIKGPFLELFKLPPVMQEGFITVNKKLYKISISDYIRSRVNVSASSIDARISNTTAPAVVVDPNQQPLGVYLGIQEDGNANMAWAEQIESLLHLEDPEEQWDIQDIA